jgi:DNA-binding NtrC family response regulator
MTMETDSRTNVLIVDNDTATTRCFLETLARRAVGGTVATTFSYADELLENNQYGLVVINGMLERNITNALRLIAKVRSSQPEFPVIMLCEELSASEAAALTVKALRGGVAI